MTVVTGYDFVTELVSTDVMNCFWESGQLFKTPLFLPWFPFQCL
jgi:hypothetical protein